MPRPTTWCVAALLCTYCSAASTYCDDTNRGAVRKDFKISTSASIGSPDDFAITDKTALGQSAPGTEAAHCAFELTAPAGKRVVIKFKVFRTQNAQVHVFDGNLANFVRTPSDKVGPNTFIAEASQTLLLSGVYASTGRTLTIEFFSGGTTAGHGGIAVEFYTVPEASTVQYLLAPPYGSQPTISWNSYGDRAKGCATLVSGGTTKSAGSASAVACAEQCEKAIGCCGYVFRAGSCQVRTAADKCTQQGQCSSGAAHFWFARTAGQVTVAPTAAPTPPPTPPTSAPTPSPTPSPTFAPTLAPTPAPGALSDPALNAFHIAGQLLVSISSNVAQTPQYIKWLREAIGEASYGFTSADVFIEAVCTAGGPGGVAPVGCKNIDDGRDLGRQLRVWPGGKVGRASHHRRRLDASPTCTGSCSILLVSIRLDAIESLTNEKWASIQINTLSQGDSFAKAVRGYIDRNVCGSFLNANPPQACPYSSVSASWLLDPPLQTFNAGGAVVARPPTPPPTPPPFAIAGTGAGPSLGSTGNAQNSGNTLGSNSFGFGVTSAPGGNGNGVPVFQAVGRKGTSGGEAAAIAIMVLLVAFGGAFGTYKLRTRRKMGAPRNRRISRTELLAGKAGDDAARAKATSLHMMDNPMSKSAGGIAAKGSDGLAAGVDVLDASMRRRAADPFASLPLGDAKFSGMVQKRNELGLWQARFLAPHPSAGARFLCYWTDSTMQQFNGVLDLLSLRELRVSHKTSCPAEHEVLKANTGERTWAFAVPTSDKAPGAAGTAAMGAIRGALAWAGRMETLRVRATDAARRAHPPAADSSNNVGGWLYKRTATRTWQRRFVPPRSPTAPGSQQGRPGDTGTLLCYYTDESQANLRGAVELSQLRSVRHSPKTASPAGTEVIKIVTNSASSNDERTFVFAVPLAGAGDGFGAAAWLRRCCVVAGRMDLLSQSASTAMQAQPVRARGNSHV